MDKLTLRDELRKLDENTILRLELEDEQKRMIFDREKVKLKDDKLIMTESEKEIDIENIDSIKFLQQ